MTAQGTGRRARLRESTLAEIRTVARKLLVSQGPAAVTINAVAREMGMSGPALYHYYSGHDQLAAALTADFYAELTEVLRQACAAHAADPPGHRLLAAARAMRGWAITHRAEFGWMFARSIRSGEQDSDSPRYQAGQDFEQIFLDQFVELWERAPFPTPRLDDLAPSLRDQLRAYSTALGGRLPPEAAHVFLSCWIRLYGLLCMEVLDQLYFVLSDVEPVFEECLRDLCATLGMPYLPPPSE